MSIVIDDVLYVSSIQSCNHIAKNFNEDSYSVRFKSKKFYAGTYVEAFRILRGLVSDVKRISELVTTITKTGVVDEISQGMFVLTDGRVVDKWDFLPNCVIENEGVTISYRERDSGLYNYYFRKRGKQYFKEDLLREFSYGFLTQSSRVGEVLRNYILSLTHLEIDGVDYYGTKTIAKQAGVSFTALNGRLYNGESVESAVRSLKSKELPVLSYRGRDFHSIKEAAEFFGVHPTSLGTQLKLIKGKGCPLDILFEDTDVKFKPYQDYTGKWWRNMSLFLKSVGLSSVTYNRREKTCKKLGAPLSLIVADCYKGFYPVRDYKGNWFISKDDLAKHYGLKSKRQLESGEGLKLLYSNTKEG